MQQLLQFIVNRLPKSLRALYDKFEELAVYVYYGLLTTLVNMVVQFVVQWYVNDKDFSAFTLGNIQEANIKTFLATSSAWLVAVIFAFYVNKKYVFHSKTESAKQLLRELITFVSARIASYFLELLIMQIGVLFYSDGETITSMVKYTLFKFLAQVIVTLSNYFFSKLVVFKKKKEE